MSFPKWNLSFSEVTLGRAPEAPTNVRLENSRFVASKMAKSLSVDSGFWTSLDHQRWNPCTNIVDLRPLDDDFVWTQ